MVVASEILRSSVLQRNFAFCSGFDHCESLKELFKHALSLGKFVDLVWSEKGAGELKDRICSAWSLPSVSCHIVLFAVSTRSGETRHQSRTELLP